MKKIVLFLFPLLLLSAGCRLDPFYVARQNVRNSKSLRIGMTKTQVLAVMGEPVKDEAFSRPDLWFYYSNMNWGDGLITEDECFPVLFEDGKLIGWGNQFYTRYRLENKDRTAVVPLPEEADRARTADEKNFLPASGVNRK